MGTHLKPGRYRLCLLEGPATFPEVTKARQQKDLGLLPGDVCSFGLKLWGRGSMAKPWHDAGPVPASIQGHPEPSQHCPSRRKVGNSVWQRESRWLQATASCCPILCAVSNTAPRALRQLSPRHSGSLRQAAGWARRDGQRSPATVHASLGAMAGSAPGPLLAYLCTVWSTAQDSSEPANKEKKKDHSQTK